MYVYGMHLFVCILVSYTTKRSFVCFHVMIFSHYSQKMLIATLSQEQFFIFARMSGRAIFPQISQCFQQLGADIEPFLCIFPSKNSGSHHKLCTYTPPPVLVFLYLSIYLSIYMRSTPHVHSYVYVHIYSYVYPLYKHIHAHIFICITHTHTCMLLAN